MKARPTKRRVLAPTGKHAFEVRQALANAGGRCQAYPRYAPGPTPVRCDAPATDVVEETGPTGLRYLAMCRACRLAGVGASSAERREKTKAFRARQLPLPIED